jgi:hypothetical protein
MSCEENESFCVSKSVKPGAISLPLDPVGARPETGAEARRGGGVGGGGDE